MNFFIASELIGESRIRGDSWESRLLKDHVAGGATGKEKVRGRRGYSPGDATLITDLSRFVQISPKSNRKNAAQLLHEIALKCREVADAPQMVQSNLALTLVKQVDIGFIGGGGGGGIFRTVFSEITN